MALLLSSVSVLSTAQPTMMTELESGDTWVGAGFATSDTDLDFTAQSNRSTGTTSVSSDGFALQFMTALKASNGLTPILGGSVTSLDSDGESATLYGISFGTLFETQDQRAMAFGVTYNGSSDADEGRESFSANLSVQTSQVTSSIYNQLAITGELMRENGDEKGGHNIDISNESKITISPMMDFIATLGMEITTDIDLENDVTVSSDPSFNFGGEINIHLDQNITASMILLKEIGGGVIDYSGEKVDVDIDSTIVGVSLMGRF